MITVKKKIYLCHVHLFYHKAEKNVPKLHPNDPFSGSVAPIALKMQKSRKPYQ
jgi:hypothetical protein